jgi:hypothetical protein
MAKSNRRKKQDRAKSAARQAEQARRRAKNDRILAQAEQLVRLADPATPPAEVAAIIDEYAAGFALGADLARLRISEGTSLEDLAETSRLLLARDGEPTDPVTEEGAPPARALLGALTFAAAVAHAGGDEAEEHRLIARALAAVETADPDDVGEWLHIVGSLVTDGHQSEALELLEPRLRNDPDDDRAGAVYEAAITQAYQNAEKDERERAALARFADRSAWDELRAALDDYLDRTNWGEELRKRLAKDLVAAQSADWASADRDAFVALGTEINLTTVTMDDDDDADIAALLERDERENPAATAVHTFAADLAIRPEVAARAATWAQHEHYGLWQVADPVAAPGVHCLDLVSGTRRYLELPAATVTGMRRWGVWLGAAVPVDGIWRGTGAGFWLSPMEGDAAVQYVERAFAVIYQVITRAPDDQRLAREPMMFGLARPYGLRWEAEDPPDDTFPGWATRVTGAVATGMISEILGYRLTSPKLHRAFAGPGVPVPGSGSAPAGWPKAWLDTRVPSLHGRTPRQAAAETAIELPLLETLLRQFEYEGQLPDDIAWLRQELDMPSLIDD